MKITNALFTVGFRPFFLGASLFSMLALSAWVSVYLFNIQLTAFSYYPATIWHAHEMIFGYSMAIIAGFILTAVKNWTGIQTVNGTKLSALFGLWVMARIAPFVFASGWVIAIIDALFLPVLAIFIALPLLKAGNKRNYFVVMLIVVFSLLNMAVHLELLGLYTGVMSLVLKFALYLIIALVIIMAGRVLPMFSQNGVEKRYVVTSYLLVEKLALPSYILFMLVMVFIDNSYVILLSSIFVTLVHALRLMGWYNSQIFRVPLVWVLHLSYLFLIVGFLISAFSAFYPALYFLALHAFSMGVIGTVTVGMMSRVSIGHTGGNLKKPPKTVKYIFILMVLATLTRVLVPIIIPSVYLETIILSGAMWSLAYLLFVFSYTRILISPRADEKLAS
jgi:uncharacterized protein involved in response to NO